MKKKRLNCIDRRGRFAQTVLLVRNEQSLSSENEVVLLSDLGCNCHLAAKHRAQYSIKGNKYTSPVSNLRGF